MHELSIISGILENIESKRESYKFSKVTSIELLCGKYNCLSEVNLQFCLNAMSESTCVSATKLKVIRCHDDSWCMNCNREFSLNENTKGICPECMSDAIIHIGSNGIYIYKLEVE